jgi:hypothetical protein
MERSPVPASYRAVWGLLVVALCAALVLWGITIGASLGQDPSAAPAPVPQTTSAPHIATVYSNIGPPNPADLCAELAPTPKEVTVESTSGVVIATVQCSK